MKVQVNIARNELRYAKKVFAKYQGTEWEGMAARRLNACVAKIDNLIQTPGMSNELVMKMVNA